MRWAETRIMWADDHRNEIEPQVLALRSFGAGVEVTSTANGAYELLGHGHVFDLVILDVLLPAGGTLPEALARIKEASRIKPESEHNGLVLALWMQETARLAPYVFYTLMGESRHKFEPRLGRMVDPKGDSFYGKQERKYWGDGIRLLVEAKLRGEHAGQH